MILTVGEQLASRTDTTQVVVVRAPSREVELTCGGVPMVPLAELAGAEQAEVSPEFAEGTQIGKRYVDAQEEFEVLVTKPGPASLAADGQKLAVKQAKALPTSD